MIIRNRHYFFIDASLLLFIPSIALLLRIETAVLDSEFWNGILIYTPLALCVRLVVFYRFGLYRRFWRYASIGELIQICNAVLFSSGVIIFALLVIWVFNPLPLPRSIPLIDSLLVLIFIGGTRFANRVLRFQPHKKNKRPPTRVLIYGAGDAGIAVSREIRKSSRLNIDLIGFVDDDLGKLHMNMQGSPVLGTGEQLPLLLTELDVKQLILAIPTASGKLIREINELCEPIGVEVKVVPSVAELLNGQVQISQLRDVRIDDLLRREAVETDLEGVRDLIRGKTVLVTGGGGSIGSELCRQIWACDPDQLVIIGHGENSVFSINAELRSLRPLPGELHAVIADIRFPERINAVFEQYQPDVVFHAAAHKHVPLMEHNPTEAISNNVFGTYNVLNAAKRVGVERFVMISTDKAVNPTSVMGVTKRIAEQLVYHAARETGRPYVVVRFGNVLGSRGSVVLTFRKQIEAGGPVTVTDRRMTRFFMTIPEAVQLVLQSAVLGSGDEVFVLDMGEPVKIVDLATDLIELSGLEVGRDIDIVFTGMRPGEKLYEELFVTGEDRQRTRHRKIFLADNAGAQGDADVDTLLASLEQMVNCNDRLEVIAELQRLVPNYQSPDVPREAVNAN